MTKQELSKVTGMSRPTIDSKLKERDKFSDLLLFVKSFEQWQFYQILEAFTRSRDGASK